MGFIAPVMGLGLFWLVHVVVRLGDCGEWVLVVVGEG